MKYEILDALEQVQNGYSLCGVVDRRARIYPLGSDTKVISTLFEIVTRQAVASYAMNHSLILVEPDKQNHYPDFTLMRSEDDPNKIAIDVKTTYRKEGQERFKFTMGSYTSYIHEATERKNIVYPHSQYTEHWVVGFVYTRIKGKRNLGGVVYSFSNLSDIPLPFDNVQVFMQEKWRIAGENAGSGNTTNIGSITGTIDDFINGNGKFHSEDEFLQYWRGYKRTQAERSYAYSNIAEFRSIQLEGEQYY